MARRTFLNRVSVEACLALIDSALPTPEPLPSERVASADALGRVTAHLVRAEQSNPSAHVAAMDGLAVRASALTGASADRPAEQRIGADAVAVDTGDAIPPGFDAVVMAEDLLAGPGGGGEGDPADAPEGSTVLVATTVVPWRHIRLAGEDIVRGDVLFPRGHRLRPADLGALLGGGVVEVEVVPRPVVAIIPTGDELVEPGEAVPPGGVVEFNSRMVAASVSEWGGDPVRRPPTPDDPGALMAALRSALSNADIVVVLAGSSAGRGDHTPGLISEAGELLAHGVNIMPGKPFAFGVVEGKPVLGLPGYPVSTQVAADRFLRRCLSRLQGTPEEAREEVQATISRRLSSRVGHKEIIRVSLGRVGPGLIATPLRRGAGVVTSLAAADGLITLPEPVEGLEAGEAVQVELMVPRACVESTLLVAGSHDLALDHLDDLLRARSPFAGLACQALGSLGGLLALARGVAHLAATHLLDPESGTYNRPYVDEHLAGIPVRLVPMARRRQGLLVAKGNPHGIEGIADLGRPGLRIVNRQRGSGTRVLFDHLLAEAGVAGGAIEGYRREELTHVAAGMAVLTNRADAAPAIEAVTEALDLDFIPLAWEPFDLVIPEVHWALPAVERLVEAVTSAEFVSVLERLQGYKPAG